MASSAPSSSASASPLLYACIAYRSTILAEHTISPASGASSLASIVLPKIRHERPEKLTYTHDQNYVHYIADAPPSHSPPSSSAGQAGASHHHQHHRAGHNDDNQHDGHGDSHNQHRNRGSNSNSTSDDQHNQQHQHQQHHHHPSTGYLTYLVVARADLGRRIPFGFLVEIRQRFLETYDARGTTDFGGMPAYGAASFNAQLQTLLMAYGTTDAGRADALSRVQGEMESVRGIMTENIERVLERGERIELLVDKTDRLGGSAREFRIRSRVLRRRMWWKNVKLMALLVVVVIFLIYLFIGFGCGLPGWSRCVGSTH